MAKNNEKKTTRPKQPSGPKDLYAEPTFMVAWLTQIFGKLVSALIRKGIVTGKADEMSRLFEGFVSKEILDHGTMVSVAGLQTSVRAIGPMVGIPSNVTEIVAGVLGEVDNGIREARTSAGGAFTQEGAGRVEKKLMDSLEERVKKALTHEEARLLLTLQEQTSLQQLTNQFKAQGGESSELWERCKAHLNSPLELRLLMQLPLKDWESHLTQKQKQAGGNKVLEGIKQFIPEGVRNAFGEENVTAARAEAARFTGAIERSIRKDRRTDRALGAILKKK